MSRPTAVLLVDDSNDDRQFFKRAVGKIISGLRLIEARDGQQAVDYLKGRGAYSDRNQYPLPTHVVLDLKMPTRSGVEVLEWIRKEAFLPNLPVVVLTSSDDPEDRRRVDALGVDAYVVKPAAFKNLLAVVKLILDRWNLTGMESAQQEAVDDRRQHE